MFQDNIMKPKKRSNLRIIMGKSFYTFKRNIWWKFSNTKFASKYSQNNLPYIFFTHKTPLIRQLKDDDMYLQYNKINNLKIAVSKLNKILVNPNETFSYWKLIGKPTYNKGYKDGMVLFCGMVGTGVGGGLCQLSNLIYWMTIHTPLTVVERYRHSYDVFPDSNRTQPFGSGATCVYNYRDLIIKNDTKDIYELVLKITDEELIGEWRVNNKPTCQYKVFEKEHSITHEFWGGYVRHNSLYREIYDKNSSVTEEFITENHAIMMYQPFLETSDIKN